MRLPKTFVLLLSFLLPTLSSATDLDYRGQVTESKSFIGLGFDAATFNVNNSDIKGSGGKIDFTHYFADDINVEVFLSSAINSQNSVSSSFTGYGAYIYYALWGSCCQRTKLISIAGSPVISEDRPLENTLNLGVGIDQYMLYGTSSVYPASGAGISVNYQFNLFEKRWRISAKKSNLSIGSTKVDGMSLSFGILFSI